MEIGNTLLVPRGLPNLDPLRLDMTKVHLAESRIIETKAVTPATCAELKATFNESLSIVNKYIAWVKYEISVALTQLDLIKAEVIIDKLPDELHKLKEKGIRDNADIRSAFISRDPEYQKCHNVAIALEAVKGLLEAKSKSFDRAYWDAKGNAEDKTSGGYPSYQTSIGELSDSPDNFMGVSRLPK